MKHIALGLLIVILAVGLAGCRGDDPPVQPEAEPAEESSGAELPEDLASQEESESSETGEEDSEPEASSSQAAQESQAAASESLASDHAQITVTAEKHSYFGVDARFDITGTPEAEIILSALHNPDYCQQDFNPTTGGALIVQVTEDAATTAYSLSTCADDRAVMNRDLDTVYHLARDLSEDLQNKYLSLPQAQVDYVAAWYLNHAGLDYYSENADAIAAVQGYVQKLEESDVSIGEEDTYIDDISLVLYIDGVLYEYTVRPVTDDDGNVYVTGGYLQAGKKWSKTAEELVRLLV